MGGGGVGAEDGMGLSPNDAPFYLQKDDHWRHFDNSVNAVSFGFVATAILISMFLVMAIFERFLRPTSSASDNAHRYTHDIESHIGFTGKNFHPSPKEVLTNYFSIENLQISIKAKEVSVLMPGEDMPTFIAHPAPVPCPPERIPWPSHQHYLFRKSTADTSSSASSGAI